jgi:hypothetical protein
MILEALVPAYVHKEIGYLSMPQEIGHHEFAPRDLSMDISFPSRAVFAEHSLLMCHAQRVQRRNILLHNTRMFEDVYSAVDLEHAAESDKIYWKDVLLYTVIYRSDSACLRYPGAATNRSICASQ